MEGATSNRRCRIAWRSKLTGYLGHGDWLDEQTAKAWLEKLKQEEQDIREHWLECE